MGEPVTFSSTGDSRAHTCACMHARILGCSSSESADQRRAFAFVYTVLWPMFAVSLFALVVLCRSERVGPALQVSVCQSSGC